MSKPTNSYPPSPGSPSSPSSSSSSSPTSFVSLSKQRAREALEAHMDGLVDLSHGIHRHPELCFDENWSASSCVDLLRRNGFEVEEGICDLPTAFSAAVGSGEFEVALCAEYDALAGIGHACGHNLIAASSLGAGIALARVADELGMKVKVFGTPGEEGGGGKILMLERGGFDGVHIAMMVHPAPIDFLVPQILAVSHFTVEFKGKQAHASAAPWEGVNAADAMTVSQVAIALLRQHLHPGEQVHGIVTDGGEAPNVIPGSTAGHFMCRAPTIGQVADVEERVKRCFKAGADATGCSLSFEEMSPAYSQMETNATLIGIYRENAESLGRTFALDDEGIAGPTLSTDMANVSLVIPSIHPLIGIETDGAVNHQPEFAKACIGRSADESIRDAALAMAWTAIDAGACEPTRRELIEAAAR